MTMKFRAVTITPWNIDIYHQWLGRDPDVYGNYWIPIDRVGESDWHRHICQKTWCTPEIASGVEEALTQARALKGKPVKTNGVYCIRSWNGAYFKIGMSTNVWRRISELQGGAPFETGVVFIAETPDHNDVERRLHLGLTPYHSNGEWYVIRGDDDGDIAAVKLMMETVLGGIPIWPGEAFPWKKRSEED